VTDQYGKITAIKGNYLWHVSRGVLVPYYKGSSRLESVQEFYPGYHRETPDWKWKKGELLGHWDVSTDSGEVRDWKGDAWAYLPKSREWIKLGTTKQMKSHPRDSRWRPIKEATGGTPDPFEPGLVEAASKDKIIADIQNEMIPIARMKRMKHRKTGKIRSVRVLKTPYLVNDFAPEYPENYKLRDKLYKHVPKTGVAPVEWRVEKPPRVKLPSGWKVKKWSYWTATFQGDEMRKESMALMIEYRGTPVFTVDYRKNKPWELNIIKGGKSHQYFTDHDTTTELLDHLATSIEELEDKWKNESVQEQKANVFIPAGTLGIPRAKMPQVKSTDVPEFLEWLKQFGVRSKAEKVPVDRLMATQKEIDRERVATMTAIAPEQALNKPVLVAKDDHIFDGHHRWLALLNRDPKFRMKVYRVSVPIQKLLSLADQFPKTTRKTIGERRSSGPHLTHRRASRTLPSGHILFLEHEPGEVETDNRHYGKYIWVLEQRLPDVSSKIINFASEHYGIDKRKALSEVNPKNIVDTAGAWDDQEFVSEVWERFEPVGFSTPDGAVVFDSRKAKIAGPFTEDEYEKRYTFSEEIEEGKVKLAVTKAIEKLSKTLHKDEDELWRELLAKPALFFSQYGQYVTPIVKQISMIT
jgi:hypothetical protein